MSAISPGSSTNKTDHHDIPEILLKLVLTTITHYTIMALHCMRYHVLWNICKQYQPRPQHVILIVFICAVLMVFLPKTILLCQIVVIECFLWIFFCVFFVCVREMHQTPIIRRTLASYSDDKLLDFCSHMKYRRTY